MNGDTVIVTDDSIELNLETSDNDITSETVSEDENMINVNNGNNTVEIDEVKSPIITKKLRKKVIKNIFITEDMIIKAINKLDNKAAAGPDGVLALLIKKCKYVLAKRFGLFQLGYQ